MEITRFINKEQRAVLSKARETYGDTAQILVANEELCELAAVCAKYPRYNDSENALKALHARAVDEVADVLIILDHVSSIFDITPVELGDRIAGKIGRLNGWLSKSTSLEQTTIDREVPGQISILSDGKRHLPCKDCHHRGKFENLKPGGVCIVCAENNGSNYMKAAGDQRDTQ